MKTALTIIELLTSISLIGLILLQAKGTGMDSSIMGSGGGEFYSSRRGVERGVFIGTIVLIVIFAIISVALLILP